MVLSLASVFLRYINDKHTPQVRRDRRLEDLEGGFAQVRGVYLAVGERFVGIWVREDKYFDRFEVRKTANDKRPRGQQLVRIPVPRNERKVLDVLMATKLRISVAVSADQDL